MNRTHPWCRNRWEAGKSGELPRKRSPLLSTSRKRSEDTESEISTGARRGEAKSVHHRMTAGSAGRDKFRSAGVNKRMQPHHPSGRERLPLGRYGEAVRYSPIGKR